MTFKEGLLKARGQITFIIALTLSTGFIIYLETLDTETRIQGQVAAELSRQRNAPPSIGPSTDAMVRANLQRSEEAFGSAPEAGTNRAALLVSLASAVQLGILKPEDGFSKAQRIVSEIERHKGEMTPVLVAALGATAVAFPSLQDRIGRLDKAP